MIAFPRRRLGMDAMIQAMFDRPSEQQLDRAECRAAVVDEIWRALKIKRDSLNV
jgi:hypothetical protein